jgi:hypothetical protein
VGGGLGALRSRRRTEVLNWGRFEKSSLSGRWSSRSGSTGGAACWVGLLGAFLACRKLLSDTDVNGVGFDDDNDTALGGFRFRR